MPWSDVSDITHSQKIPHPCGRKMVDILKGIFFCMAISHYNAISEAVIERLISKGLNPETHVVDNKNESVVRNRQRYRKGKPSSPVVVHPVEPSQQQTPLSTVFNVHVDSNNIESLLIEDIKMQKLEVI